MREEDAPHLPAQPPANPVHVDAHPCADGFQFRRLLDKLPAGAYTCDAAGLITYFNQHAVELWGRAPKLNDPVDRFCGSFKLFAADGTPIPHDQCWMALALRERPRLQRAGDRRRAARRQPPDGAGPRQSDPRRGGPSCSAR